MKHISLIGMMGNNSITTIAVLNSLQQSAIHSEDYRIAFRKSDLEILDAIKKSMSFARADGILFGDILDRPANGHWY